MKKLSLTVKIPAARTNNFVSPQGGYDRFAKKMEEVEEELIRYEIQSVAALGNYNS